MKRFSWYEGKLQAKSVVRQVAWGGDLHAGQAKWEAGEKERGVICRNWRLCVTRHHRRIVGKF